MKNLDTRPNQVNENDFFDSEEFKKVDFVERNNICEIAPNGVTFTLNNVFDWVKESLKYIKESLEIKDNDSINAYIWPYRYDNGNTQYISFDLSNDENKKYCSINFVLGGEHSFNLKQPTVPDCVEAIHMIGLITSALKIKAEIGKHTHEINEYCKPNIHLEEG
jgi:hypothetical protein